jgi:hypothetical protein
VYLPPALPLGEGTPHHTTPHHTDTRGGAIRPARSNPIQSDQSNGRGERSKLELDSQERGVGVANSRRPNRPDPNRPEPTRLLSSSSSPAVASLLLAAGGGGGSGGGPLGLTPMVGGGAGHWEDGEREEPPRLRPGTEPKHESGPEREIRRDKLRLLLSDTSSVSSTSTESCNQIPEWSRQGGGAGAPVEQDGEAGQGEHVWPRGLVEFSRNSPTEGYSTQPRQLSSKCASTWSSSSRKPKPPARSSPPGVSSTLEGWEESLQQLKDSARSAAPVSSLFMRTITAMPAARSKAKADKKTKREGQWGGGEGCNPAEEDDEDEDEEATMRVVHSSSADCPSSSPLSTRSDEHLPLREKGTGRGHVGRLEASLEACAASAAVPPIFAPAMSSSSPSMKEREVMEQEVEVAMLQLRDEAAWVKTEEAIAVARPHPEAAHSCSSATTLSSISSLTSASASMKAKEEMEEEVEVTRLHAEAARLRNQAARDPLIASLASGSGPVKESETKQKEKDALGTEAARLGSTEAPKNKTAVAPAKISTAAAACKGAAYTWTISGKDIGGTTLAEHSGAAARTPACGASTKGKREVEKGVSAPSEHPWKAKKFTRGGSPNSLSSPSDESSANILLQLKNISSQETVADSSSQSPIKAQLDREAHNRGGKGISRSVSLVTPVTARLSASSRSSSEGGRSAASRSQQKRPGDSNGLSVEGCNCKKSRCLKL